MSSNNLSIARSGYPRSLGLGRVVSSLVGIVSRVMLWSETARQRCSLQELDDHMLMDIGLSRADVEIEASKPFWSVSD